MFPSWRMKIWDARRALKAGRWDEATALLQQESVRDFLPAKRLSQEVATLLAERAQQRIEANESSAGWQDMRLAAQLGGSEQQLGEIRQAYAERCLQRVRHYLACGETTMASEQINKLQRRHLGGQERRAWKLIIGLISRSKQLARHGKVRAADENLQRAKLLLPDPEDSLADEISQRQERLRADGDRISQINTALHEALGEENWTTVLTLAESLIELAPEHEAARQARRLAWQSVGMDATRVNHKAPNARVRPAKLRHFKSTRNGAAAKEDTMTANNEPGKRLVSWIDGVGGYLICLGDDVMIGQPASPAQVDIPIFADLSRRHASLKRDGESYVLTPVHNVSVNGQKLAGPMVLGNEALIELGESVKIRFRKPHALSATAILTLESPHKLEPAVDGIILMADSCILGSQSHSHIRCRDWEKDLVLFRRGQEIFARSADPLEIDGEPADIGAPLPANCRLEAENLALSFEDI